MIPVRSGWARTILRLSLPVTLTTFVMGGCGKNQAPPAQGPPVVIVARPLQREIVDSFDFPGRTAAVENVDIRARVSGYLTKVHFKEGLSVQLGDLLFEIDPSPYQALVNKAKAEVAQAQSTADLSRVEYQRLDELMKIGSATQIEYDRMVAERARADAALMVAKAALESAQIDLDWTKVSAPLSGRISRKYVNEGNLVVGGSVGATLLTNIVAVDPIHCYFDVDERSLLSIQQAMREHRMTGYTQGGKVPVFLALANEKGFPHEGVVDFVENKVDVATGTLGVRAIFPNPDRMLLPGLFTRVRVPIGAPRNAIMISERAISMDQGQRFVMVVGDDQKTQYRRVSVGLLEAGMREIVEGVAANDWVIARGLQRVRPGMLVQAQRTNMSAAPGEDRTQATTSTSPAASRPSTRPAAD